MADKITQTISDALARAAAHAEGLPLYAVKSEQGLFPNTSAARPAAQKCLADGLLHVVGTDTRGKSPRELYALTDPGWEFLLALVNPKPILEDFVRALEARQGEVGELLDTAQRMADSLQGLKDAVARVLPGVSATRVQQPSPATSASLREGGNRLAPSTLGGEVGQGTAMVALLEAPPETDLAPVILARLADWSGSAGEDCPLPELYRSLSLLDSPPSIGAFHDCLRKLHAEAHALPAPVDRPALCSAGTGLRAPRGPQHRLLRFSSRLNTEVRP